MLDALQNMKAYTIIGMVAMVGLAVFALLNAFRVSKGKKPLITLIGFGVFALVMAANIVFMPSEFFGLGVPDDVPASAGDEAGSTMSPGTEPLGDYYVSVLGAALMEDAGVPALVVTFTWTNSGEKTTCAEAEVVARAFQGGEQLEGALLESSAQYDPASGWRNVEPGGSAQVQVAFTLNSYVDVIQFQLTPLIGYSDDKVTALFDPSIM